MKKNSSKLPSRKARAKERNKEIIRVQLQTLDYRGNPVDGPKWPYKPLKDMR